MAVHRAIIADALYVTALLLRCHSIPNGAHQSNGQGRTKLGGCHADWARGGWACGVQCRQHGCEEVECVGLVCRPQVHWHILQQGPDAQGEL